MRYTSNAETLRKVAPADDILINVPVERTARIQEVHITIIHALCDAVDYMLLGGD